MYYAQKSVLCWRQWMPLCWLPVADTDLPLGRFPRWQGDSEWGSFRKPLNAPGSATGHLTAMTLRSIVLTLTFREDWANLVHLNEISIHQSSHYHFSSKSRSGYIAYYHTYFMADGLSETPVLTSMALRIDPLPLFLTCIKKVRSVNLHDRFTDRTILFYCRNARKNWKNGGCCKTCLAFWSGKEEWLNMLI